MGYAFVYLGLSRKAQSGQLLRALWPSGSLLCDTRLPADAVVTVSPNASGVGWIYQYALVDESGSRDLARAAPAQRIDRASRAAGS